MNKRVRTAAAVALFAGVASAAFTMSGATASAANGVIRRANARPARPARHAPAAHAPRHGETGWGRRWRAPR